HLMDKIVVPTVRKNWQTKYGEMLPEPIYRQIHGDMGDLIHKEMKPLMKAGDQAGFQGKFDELIEKAKGHLRNSGWTDEQLERFDNVARAQEDKLLLPLDEGGYKINPEYIEKQKLKRGAITP